MADGQVVLVGHLLVATFIGFCLQHPSRVKALVLIGAGTVLEKKKHVASGMLLLNLLQ